MKVNPEVEYAQRHLPPERWRIAGVRLLPLRLGHKLILLSEESPFFCQDQEFTPRALLSALWVCSRSYREASRQRVSFAWAFRAKRLIGRFKKNDDLFWGHVESFFKYLGEEYANPKRIRKVGRDGQPASEATISPSLMCFKRDLIGRYRSEDEFWELPMRVAIGDCFGIAEANGSVKWPSVSEEVAK